MKMELTRNSTYGPIGLPPKLVCEWCKIADAILIKDLLTYKYFVNT